MTMGKRKKTNTVDIQELDPNLLTLDPDVQPRNKVTQTLVQQYAQDMEAGDVFPPVVVYSDGGVYWVADGFHRVQAAISAGLTTIKVEVHKGGKRDAILYAVGSNSTHGLRRTNKDKRRAVLALLEDEEWSDWTDREIARRCRVSHVFVGKVRAELSGNGYQMNSKRKVSRGGMDFEMDTANIGSQSGGGDDEADEAGADEAVDPGSSDSDESDEGPDEEIPDPPDTQDSASDTADDLVGALDDILGEVRDDGGGDGEVESDGGDAPEVQGDEPDDAGDTTDATDPGDNYVKTPGLAPLPDAAPSASTSRWALVKVSGSKFGDQQAAAIRERLEYDAYTHVLIVKTTPGSTGYPALQWACEVLGEAGYPLQFQGHLLLSGKHVVWATVACRDEGQVDHVELVERVLGCRMVEIEDIGDGEGRVIHGQ